jgi:hypothetical protein
VMPRLDKGGQAGAGGPGIGYAGKAANLKAKL